MSSTQNTVTINIGLKEPKQFLADLHEAICEVKILLFERRALDLGEPETFALAVLTDLQKRIV